MVWWPHTTPFTYQTCARMADFSKRPLLKEAPTWLVTSNWRHCRVNLTSQVIAALYILMPIFSKTWERNLFQTPGIMDHGLLYDISLCYGRFFSSMISPYLSQFWLCQANFIQCLAERFLISWLYGVFFCFWTVLDCLLRFVPWVISTVFV